MAPRLEDRWYDAVREELAGGEDERGTCRGRPVTRRPEGERVEFCHFRKEPTGEWCGKDADMIVWGKLFPPEALGPRCEEHAAEQLGWRTVDDRDVAIFRLRDVMPLSAVRELVEAGNEFLMAAVHAEQTGTASAIGDFYVAAEDFEAAVSRLGKEGG